MGRPRKTPVEELFPGANKDDQDLDDFLEEVGASTAYIDVLLMKPDGSRPQLGRCNMDAIREDAYEFLRSTYGAGKYLLMFRGSDRKYKSSKILEVAANTNGGSNNGGGAGPMGSHDRLIDTLLIGLLQNMKPQSFDMGSMMAGLAAVMTAIKPADNSAKAVDPLAMFQSILTMYQSLKPANEKSELEKMRDVAGLIKEFSSERGEGPDSAWGMIADVGKEAINKLGPTLSALVPGVPGGPRPAVATATAMQPAGQLQPADPAADLQRWVQHEITFLKGKARVGRDPRIWVDYVLDEGDEPGCQAVCYVIRQGAPFESLLSFDPEIAQNPQLQIWFKEVFDGIKAGLLQADVDSGGDRGDQGNIEPNGPARPAGQSTGVRPVAGPELSQPVAR